MKNLLFIGLLAIIFACFQSLNVSAQSMELIGPQIDTSFTLHVDYEPMIEDLTAAGKYFAVSNNISRYYFGKEKKTGKDTLEAFLFGFPREISSKDVLFWMEKKKCRPATLKELQILGIQIPNLQKKFLIIGLGSKSWTLFNLPLIRHVPALSMYWDNFSDTNPHRCLYLYRYDSGWNTTCRFLAVKKD